MLLRLIVKSIALDNNIVPLSSRCDYSCGCSGYCEKLRAELNWLFDEFERIGLSNCTDAAQRLREQSEYGLANPENFEPNELFFVRRKKIDEDDARLTALSEEEAQPSEWIDCPIDEFEDTEDSDPVDSSQE